MQLLIVAIRSKLNIRLYLISLHKQERRSTQKRKNVCTQQVYQEENNTHGQTSRLTNSCHKTCIQTVRNLLKSYQIDTTLRQREFFRSSLRFSNVLEKFSFLVH